jgi:Protein of unknown function (DUF2283)
LGESIEGVIQMKIQYFQETDTLYIEFKTAEVAESKDLDGTQFSILMAMAISEASR